MNEVSENENYTGLEVAVIGMAGQFPGAKNIRRYWNNIKNGVESITFFTDKELEEAGVGAEMLRDPGYIKASGYLEGMDAFDADFFGYSPAEARILDPQLRLFHQCAWEALEDAAYVPADYDGLIGLYAGASDNFYWKSLLVLSGKREEVGEFEIDQMASKDYLCARTAYKLDLKGPVMFVHTACSTSLVAIHAACQALLSGETDIALAGGVSVAPFKAGYFYREGMIQSPDGHTRAFDHHGKGTLAGNGLGVVVLKRLEEAVEDRDSIYAVIRGSAVNNDGTRKMGFTAPSVEGQVEAVKDALNTARVGAESIGYVEAHGTGTPLGDPVEIEALTLAYETHEKGYCAVGSVKSNIGHLDTAAGVAGFIKAVLALKHRVIPPALNFQVPNKNIDFINGPFYINTESTPWERGEFPRRAAVSSLGLGGTNAHVILEEWPEDERPAAVDAEAGGRHLIVLSAMTQTALERMKENLAGYLKENPGVSLANAAYTLQVGRKAFQYRWMTQSRTVEELIHALTAADGDGDGEPVDIDLTDPAGEGRYRISLPTYPFEQKPYTVAGNILEMGAQMFGRKDRLSRKTDIADWFYVPSWKRSLIDEEEAPTGDMSPGGSWLLFIPDEAVFPGARLASELENRGETVIVVSDGGAFQKTGDRRFVLRPGEESDYDRLFSELEHTDQSPLRIVHMWTAGENRGDADRAFFSLLNIARACGKQGITGAVQLTVVTSGVQEVTGEEALCPHKAVVMGPVKVIPTEYPNIRCRGVDVVVPPPGTAEEDRLIRQLAGEMKSPSPDPVVAYRGSHRWIQVFDPVPFREARDPNIPLRQEGVYLITGGLGGIGFVLSQYLAGKYRAKLVLTGRTAVDDEKRRTVTALERSGAEVLVCRADTADLEQMRGVFRQAGERFGPVNGVIHCAGLPDGEMIQRRTPEASRRIFSAKIDGTMVLDTLLDEPQRREHLDFLLLCSSITAVLPVIGQVAYTSANAFLDAYAHYRNARYMNGGAGSPVTVSVNWDRWQGVGIAVIAENRHNELTGEKMEGGITRAEGTDVFQRILARPSPPSQVAVSTRDIAALLEQAYTVNAASLLEGLDETAAHKELLPRPELPVPYDPPVTATQQALARIWGRFFGFQRVGIRDDFFQLGGDSLKVLTLLPRIHRELEVNVPITEFFNRPTIGQLALYIDGGEKSPYSAIEPAEKREYYPLSSAQRRLYLLQQMDLTGTGYNIPEFFPVGNDVDRERLEATFRKLIARHESLRTSFIVVDDEPVQRIHDDVMFALTFCGTRGTHPVSEFIKPFDLSKAPLIRSGLIPVPGGGFTWFIDVHHIVSDGISQTILIEDFLALYNDEEPEPVKLQYKDFTQWQNRLFEEGALREQESYWLELYADAADIPRPQLPGDFTRPGVFNFKGDRYAFVLEQDLALKFRGLGTRTGATLFMNLLAALNVLLYKYTGLTDIVIGSGIAGRNHDDVRRTIGMFVNTLPMRNSPHGEKTYETFLKEVVSRSIDDLRNQDIRFEELVDKLDLPRDPSRNPLFDISMVVMNFRPDVGESEAGALISLEGENRNLVSTTYQNAASRFDMTLFIYEPGEEIYIDIEYYSAVFARETVERLVSHLETVVNAVSDRPSVPLKEIDILSDDEKEQILHEWNRTGREYPADKTVHALFEEQARKTPDRTALIFEDRALTYRMLNRRADILSALLRSKGVAEEVPVGIEILRRPEMVAGILGILKAGGCYVPVDPKAPQARKDYILEDSNAKVLLRDLSEMSGEIEVNALRNNPESPPTRLCYIMYTSGSTGRPKGVMVEHRGVVRLVKNTNFISFEDGDVMVAVGALGFDISTFEIWGALLNGLRLCLAAEEVLLDWRDLEACLHRYDISILNLVPALFNILARQSPRMFDSVRCMTLGGELVRPGDVREVCEGARAPVLLHMYGPTENTTFSTYLAVEEGNDTFIPIGRPVANSTVFILDRDGGPLPVGAAGEIHTGGPGLARGYLNNPELTAERFCRGAAPPKLLTPYPLPLTPLYRTGDIGRWLSDGTIQFLGRRDHQVKVRGVRIELGEIESRLLEIDGIKEAVVVARPDRVGESTLCAYVVSTRECEFAEIRETLSRVLPPALVPSFFIPLDAMPYTATGKIDRKSLPDVQFETGMPRSRTAPRDAVETDLAGIWREVLEIGEVGIDDNFFDLGGHSLRAAALTSRIHRELGVKVPLAEIFKNQELRSLADYIRHAGKHGGETRYAFIEPVEKKDYYPQSSAQKRVYLIQQMDPESTGYNMPFVLPLGEDIDKERFELAFKRLIARHESLRTSFHMIDDRPVQRIHDDVRFAITYCGTRGTHPGASRHPSQEGIDGGNASRGGDWVGRIPTQNPLLRGVPEGRGVSEPGIRPVSEFVKPFDLSKAPLIRSVLIEQPDGGLLWFTDIHHIVSDGTSQTVLIEDFAAYYKDPDAPGLPGLRIQYKDFSQWQGRMFEGSAVRAQEEYWLRLFPAGEDIPALELPADRKRPDVFTFAGAAYRFTLDRADVIAFDALGSAHGATLYMNVLTLLNVLFYKYTGAGDIVIGTGMAGRNHADLQPLIGMFVNILPMRNHPNGDKTYASFLNEVVSRSIDALDNQDVQFEHLVEKLDIKRDTSRNPLFDVTLVVQNFKPVGEEISSGVSITGVLYKNTTSKFDMTFSVFRDVEDIYVDIEYYTGLFEEETVKRLVSHLNNTLKAVVHRPGIPLKDIDIIPGDEKRRLLFDFNDTFAEYPADKTVHELFREQAEITPDHTVLVFENEAITYRCLNRRVGALAALLRSKGVETGVPVGIETLRRPHMVAGILGILEAGGCYVPVDPKVPGARKQYILKDSNAKVLLSEMSESMEMSKEIEVIALNNPPGTPPADPVRRNKPDQLCYIMYTSGSTGRPKGVMVEHRGVVRLVKNTNFISFEKEDVYLAVGTLGFDISTFEIWAPLLNRLRLCLAAEEVLLNWRDLEASLHRFDISVLNLVPALFNNFARQSPRMFDSLRCLTLGGELVRPGDIREVRKGPRAPVILHMYGPTENTTFSTFLEVEKDHEAYLPIGKPVANSTVYILDAHGHLLPIGAAGEIHTGGPGLARGYLNNPELTAQRFCNNRSYKTYRTYRTYNLYNTGDIGRWLPDGTIQFLGRRDHQVKVRGVRIELEEIENHLLSVDKIKEVVVLALPDAAGELFLCAYIVSTDPIDPSELRETLSDLLPAAMIPNYYIPLDKMPLTATGKIDRKALPAPGMDRSPADAYTAPRDETEEKLAAIWSDVLERTGQPAPGIDDNFFELGGHSLKAAVIVSRIHKEFQVKVSLQDIFKSQTIRGLGEIIKKASGETYIEIEPVPPKEYYELSFNQKRLWIIQQMNLEDNAYNMPGAIMMGPEADVRPELIARAVETLIRRHESLRTGFKEIDGSAVQFIVHDFQTPFESVDVSRLEADEKQTRLKQSIDEFNLAPFRLDRAPLFRSILIKVDDGHHIFAYNMHHIVTDGWSMEILEKDFHRLYNTLLAGGETGDLEKASTVTYKDFAQWHNRRLENASGQSGDLSRQFWITFLKGDLPPLRLPRDFRDAGTRQKNGANYRFVVPGTVKDALKTLSREFNLTLFSLMYSIYNIFLSTVSGQSTVVSSIVNAGRDHPSLRDIVGFFVNSVIFKLETDSGEEFIELAKRVQVSVFEFFGHQNYPLELVLDEVGVTYPEVTASFNMINIRSNETVSLDNLEPSHQGGDGFGMQNVKFDIEAYVSEYGNGIEILVTYNKNLFKAGNIELLMKKYREQIEFFALNPHKQLKEYKETKKRKSFKPRGAGTP